MPLISASAIDSPSPRPQLVRASHALLDGESGFAYDDANRGLAEGWMTRSDVFTRTITLPFPPESPASGIADPGYHPVVWYRIAVTAEDLERAGGTSQRLLLHFGAVDYSAQVWVDGVYVGSHEGGQTPFSFDITHALALDAETHHIVLRAEDQPLDVAKPRGKQDWLPEPHVIWYERTTGIWQSVWLEAVPEVSIDYLAWSSDIPNALVHLDIELSEWVDASSPLELRVALSYDGVTLARQVSDVVGQRARIVLPVAALANGQHYETLLWSPETPRLWDAKLELMAGGDVVDEVTSYLGVRSAAVGSGAFWLNDRPYYLRSVLEQGYWPQSHLTAPSADAVRAEVELIKSLGFNAVRVHQKAEDPRFLFWCDRLGLCVWGETASCYEFSPTAVQRMTTEWMEIVRRDVSHPSIVTWVPLNESWGVQHIAHQPAQQAYAVGLVNLTRALDGSRPVVGNDGWEMADTDIVALHDYSDSGAVLESRYRGDAALGALAASPGPAGRKVFVGQGRVEQGSVAEGAPIMLTEFGGVRFDVAPSEAGAGWGYSTAVDAEDFERRLGELLGAAHRCSSVMNGSVVNGSAITGEARVGVGTRGLAGFCWTQLTDTRQEVNGLCDEWRKPKLDVEVLRALVEGR